MNLRDIIVKRAKNDKSTPLMEEDYADTTVPEEEMEPSANSPDEVESVDDEFNVEALKDALSDGQIKMDEFKNDIKSSIELIMKALDKDVIAEVVNGLSEDVKSKIREELGEAPAEAPMDDYESAPAE